MKTAKNFIGPIALVFVLGCLAFSHQLPAACPEICDVNDNTGLGNGVFSSVTNGMDNTAVGGQALQQDQDGHENTAVGRLALTANISGNDNTALGFAALDASSGSNNTASGAGALQNNQSGNDNTATGRNALTHNQTGGSNAAMGENALQSNIDGNFNTACGTNAQLNSLHANFNVAVGGAALFHDSSGSDNTAAGVNALLNNTTGGSNTALGENAGSKLTTGGNNIDLGANVAGKAGEANTIRLGTQGTQKSTFIAGISGTAVTGAQVVVSSAGKLGVAGSSERFKQAIQPMNATSEAILKLKPVTFRYREEIDGDKLPQFGLIAEEVQKVAPELVVHDANGKPFTVRYDAINAMLLNEFLKEHQNVSDLQKRDAVEEQLKATIARQQKQIETLEAGLQKVGAAVAAQASERRTACAQP